MSISVFWRVHWDILGNRIFGIHETIMCISVVAGSLEVKFPTIWTDEMGRVTEEKRREEKRRKKIKLLYFV